MGLALAALNAGWLLLAFPPFNLWFLAWISFVPFILAQYRMMPPKLASFASPLLLGYDDPHCMLPILRWTEVAPLARCARRHGQVAFDPCVLYLLFYPLTTLTQADDLSLAREQLTQAWRDFGLLPTDKVAPLVARVTWGDADIHWRRDETLGWITNANHSYRNPENRWAATDFARWDTFLDITQEARMTTIPIPDPWLRRALQEATGSKTVTPESLAELTELDWSEYRAEAGMAWGQIKDIAPLRHCANLRVLSFDGNAVRDLGPLAACPLLEEVWLVGNNVTDVSPLQGAQQLHTLNLDMNYRLADIAALRGLPALRYLNIGSTAVTGIAPLLDLPALQEVTLYYLPLDLSPNAADRQVLVELLRRDVGINFQGIETLLEEVRAEQAAALGDAPTLAAQLAALGARDIATLLSAGDINAHDADGYTLFHLAVKLKPFSSGADPVIDRPALTRLLLAQPGIQVDARGAGGHTPLAYLTDNSYLTDIAVVQLLLEASADPNAPCDCQMTPVEHALSCKRRDIVDLLVAHGGDAFTPRAVNEYCKKGDVARVQQALASGYDVSAREPKFSESALHAAAFGGCAEVVRLLLDHGADANAQAASANTPLHAADNAEVAQLLLDAGAAVDARDSSQQQTPLFRAAYLGRLDVVRTLIAHGADVNARDDQGKTPLHNCLYWDAQDATLNIISALVEAGADPNALDTAGQTPLDCYRQPEMRKHLRALGGKTGKTVSKRQQ